jgi:hypothetical protein
MTMRRIAAALTVLACLLALAAGVDTPPMESGPRWTAVPDDESGLGPVDADIKWPWMTSAVDVDGDGDLDFCVYGHHGVTANREQGSGFWYLNDGKGRFRRVRSWKEMGSIQGWWYDFSGDGVLDMIGYEAAFGKWFLNDGKGNFTDIGKVICSGPIDADGDGIFQEFTLGGRGAGGTAGIYKLDPPVASMQGARLKPVPKLLWDYESLGIDKLDEMPEGSERGVALNHRACCDLDGDGVNDLIIWRHVYLHGQQVKIELAMRSWVFLGRKGGPPELANGKLGLPDCGGHAFVPADLNRDACLDLLDINSGEIYLNDGKGKFIRSEKRLFPDAPEWRNTVFAGDGANELVDFANTGVPAVRVTSDHGYASGRNAGLFLHDGKLNFTRLETSQWPAWLRDARNCGWVIVPGDFDDDGDLDVVVTRGQKEVLLYHNEGIPGNHYLRVKPIQKVLSNSAMGCKLWVYQAGRLGQADGLIGYTQASPGGTSLWGAAVPVVIHTGLGRCDTVDLRLRFPISGKVVEQRNVKADQMIVLNEE